jgi:hypothetical protein
LIDPESVQSRKRSLFDAANEAEAFQCCLDESGTHGTSPTTVVAGLNLRKRSFVLLHHDWGNMLRFHCIRELHIRKIRTFLRSEQQRRDLLFDAVTLINLHKHSTISAVLNAEKYREYFGSTFHRLSMSIYGMCFMICIYMNYKTAQHNNYNGQIKYLMASGNPLARHVTAAHDAATDLQSGGWSLRVGGLAFEDGQRALVLQAADLIAWAALRRATNGQFHGELEPLLGIFDSCHIEGEAENFLPELSSKLKGLDLN